MINNWINKQMELIEINWTSKKKIYLVYVVYLKKWALLWMQSLFLIIVDDISLLHATYM